MSPSNRPRCRGKGGILDGLKRKRKTFIHSLDNIKRELRRPRPLGLHASPIPRALVTISNRLLTYGDELNDSVYRNVKRHETRNCALAFLYWFVQLTRQDAVTSQLLELEVYNDWLIIADLTLTL